jgi:hypothetical protein
LTPISGVSPWISAILLGCGNSHQKYLTGQFEPLNFPPGHASDFVHTYLGAVEDTPTRPVSKGVSLRHPQFAFSGSFSMQALPNPRVHDPRVLGPSRPLMATLAFNLVASTSSHVCFAHSCKSVTPILACLLCPFAQ